MNDYSWKTSVTVSTDTVSTEPGAIAGKSSGSADNYRYRARTAGDGVVGRPLPRLDAVPKVSGRAKYAGDLHFPEMLHGKVVLAGCPSAVIKGIDVADAMRLPGVAIVLTARDISGKPTPVKERPVLARDRVRYSGDGVALVAAVNRSVAEEAARLVRVVLEETESVFTVEEALKEGAPVVHGDSNIFVHHKVRKGDVSRGFSDADVVIERTYSTQRVYPLPIEPEAAVAQPCYGPDCSMIVHVACKSPFNVRRLVADTLGLDESYVRVVQTTMGGSFGGKDSDAAILAARVALLAQATGKPVKMVYSREESLTQGITRHPYHMRYRIGAKRNGRIVALEATIYADAGAYASKTPLVTWRSAVEATGPYEIPNIKTDVYGVFTNNPPSDAVRGFGSPQVNFAVELLMDELAEDLGMDKVEIRLLNGFKEGSSSATGQIMRDVSLAACIERVRDEIGWNQYGSKQEREYGPKENSVKRGIGFACSFRGSALGAGGEALDAAAAVVSIQRDGSIILSTGIGDLGQGSMSAFTQIVCEILGMPVERARFLPVDTSIVPDSGPTVASRGTVVGGNAFKIAAEKVREVLVSVAADMAGSMPSQIFLSGGYAVCQSANWQEDSTSKTGSKEEAGVSVVHPSAAVPQGRLIPLDEVIRECYRRGLSLYGFGWYKAPDVWWDSENGCGDAYFHYVYGASAAIVEVDVETGEVTVLKQVSAHDVGVAVNPAEVKGQICGGIAMGQGYALLEEARIAEGLVKTPNLDTYLVPTALDVPECVPLIVEQPDNVGPFGARGLGEPATQIVAPAIVNAICDALGTRIYRIPVRLEDVVKSRRL